MWSGLWAARHSNTIGSRIKQHLSESEMATGRISNNTLQSWLAGVSARQAKQKFFSEHVSDDTNHGVFLFLSTGLASYKKNKK